MLERIADQARGPCGLTGGQDVLVLVSGGADSTLLLLGLVAAGFDVRALHVAHGLRGAASDADRDFCAALCARLDVPLAVVDGRVAAGGNLEARLRARRRAAALDAALPAAAIATGHTASDVAETVLYRLATSGGVRAVAPLPARAGRFVRPLLCLTRSDVRRGLVAMGETWRDDATNADPRPARNHLRLRVLPLLAELNPAADLNIARTAARAADERELLDSLAADLVDDDGSVDLTRLRAAHPALQRIALRSAAARAGAVLADRDVEIVRALGVTGHERRCVGRGVVAERIQARLRFVPEASSSSIPAPAVLPVPGQVAFGSHAVRARVGAGAAIGLGLAGGLAVRGVVPGDRLPGVRRSVGELLQRAGVAGPERAAFPLVTADGEPVALPGIAIAPAARAVHGILLDTVRV